MSSKAPSLLVQAHILMLEGMDTPVDRIVREDGRVRMIIVFVSEPAMVAQVAVDLVNEDGVELIELDGGLGPVWAANVIEAIDGRIPVGFVTFGAESLRGAAAYGARYEAQTS